MDIYQNYAFDYVDWLFGDEAAEKYLLDHPEMTLSEAKDTVEEYGYIRNIDPSVKWFGPTDETVYYMPDEMMSVEPVEVDYETFRDMMIPALENGEIWMTFVEVTISGENIVRIEWVFHP